MDHASESNCSSPLSSVPSSPLTEFSRSPTPPEDMMHFSSSRRSSGPYPSPPASQQTSLSGSPVPDGMDSKTQSDREGPPPAKRRRVSEKGRTTEHLDLSTATVHPDGQVQLDRLLKVLHKSQKIVVIAGAGISVSAGIPDFRSSQGLFRSLKEEYNLKGSGKDLFDASVYKDDVGTTTFHEMVSTMSRLTKDAKPTAFHHMLATIAQEDRLLRLYSQNVDGIDTSLDPLKTAVPLRKDSDSNKWPRTVQLHGGLDHMVCSKCQDCTKLDPDLFSGAVPPLCSSCEAINDVRTNTLGKRSHGIGRLRPRMVLYNEHNPDDEAIGAVTKEDLRKRPDAVIVVGTTLKVPGVRRIVREMCATVRDRRGGVAVWINSDPPPIAKDLEDCWDIIVKGPCDEVARHAAMRKWNESVAAENVSEISDEDAEQVIKKSLDVRLSPTPPFAPREPLPSALHLNNSFAPPLVTETPKKPIASPEWSPLTIRSTSVVHSIEEDVATGENITVVHSQMIPSSSQFTGLLTPSKSRRSSPAADKPTKDPNAKKGSLLDHLKGTNKPQQSKTGPNKGSKRAAPMIKGPNVKYVKPHLSQKKTKNKSTEAAVPKKTLKNSFSSSKLASLQRESGKEEADLEPEKSPSKLRQVRNASADPMQPVPLQDSRINASPVQSKEDKETAMEQMQEANGRSRMSVSSIIN